MDLNDWERKIFENETNCSLVEGNRIYYSQAHGSQPTSAIYKNRTLTCIKRPI